MGNAFDVLLVCKVCAEFQHHLAEFVTRLVSQSGYLILVVSVQRSYPRASGISFDNYFSQQKRWFVPWGRKRISDRYSRE